MFKATISALFCILFMTTALPLKSEVTQKYIKDTDVYTLYSTNHPKPSGRSGVATFDLSSELFNKAMCEDAANLYQADFEKLKASSRYDGTTNMRYWCEKGRFRP